MVKGKYVAKATTYGFVTSVKKQFNFERANMFEIALPSRTHLNSTISAHSASACQQPHTSPRQAREVAFIDKLWTGSTTLQFIGYLVSNECNGEHVFRHSQCSVCVEIDQCTYQPYCLGGVRRPKLLSGEKNMSPSVAVSNTAWYLSGIAG